MSDTWVGVVNSVRPKYVRGFADMTIRKRLRLAMLKRRGRMEMNQSGDKCIWRLKYSKPNSQGYADGSSLDFSNHQPYRELSINWRGLINTDSFSLMQHAMNTGNNQMINLFQDKANNVMSGLDEDFHGELFKDGEAATRLTHPHGNETFLADDGATGAADKVARPSDTYGLGSLSTIPGNDGGSWSSDLATSPNATLATDWPDGKGSREYDYNSPTLLNATSNNWGTGATTWEANCWRVISQGLTWMTVNSGKDGAPDLVSLSKDYFQDYKEHHEAIRRITIPHREAADLGFSKNTLNQDGVAIHCEFDIPAATGYIENLDHVTVSSLFPEMYWLVHGYDKVGGAVDAFLQAMDIRTLSMLIVGGFFGNVKYKPKYVGKISPYA